MEGSLKVIPLLAISSYLYVTYLSHLSISFFAVFLRIHLDVSSIPNYLAVINSSSLPCYYKNNKWFLGVFNFKANRFIFSKYISFMVSVYSKSTSFTPSSFSKRSCSSSVSALSSWTCFIYSFFIYLFNSSLAIIYDLKIYLSLSKSSLISMTSLSNLFFSARQWV